MGHEALAQSLILLEESMDSYDAEAKDLLMSLRSDLTGRDLMKEYKSMVSAVDEYDFEEALELLKAVLDSFKT